MKPVRCIAPAHEQGDCWRACLASILNLPPDRVPNFADLAGDDEGAWDRMFGLARKWLAERGLAMFRTYCSAGWEFGRLLEVFSRDNPGVPIIISGQCRRCPADNHAVVALDGDIHDPSGSGIIGPCVGHDGSEGWWWLDIVSFGHGSTLQSTNLERPE